MAREITTRDEARVAIQEVARRLGVTVERLLDPRDVPEYLEQSELFRNVWRFAEDEEEAEE